MVRPARGAGRTKGGGRGAFSAPAPATACAIDCRDCGLGRRRKDKYNFVLYVPEVRHHEFRVTDADKVVLELEINPVKKLMGKLVGQRARFRYRAGRAFLIDEAARRIAKFMRYVAKRGWIRFKEVKQA